MQRKWFYLHDGETFGPLTVSQIKELAAARKILPMDKLWRDGTDPKNATLAGQALDFSMFTAAHETPAANSGTAPTAPAGPVLDPVLFGTAAEARPTSKKKEHGSKVKKGRKPQAPGDPTPAPRGEAPLVPAPPEAPAQAPLAAIPVEYVVPLPYAVPVNSAPIDAILMDATAPGAEPAPAVDAVLGDTDTLPPAVAAVHEAGISLNERYRRACAALSQWADRDDNVPLILAGDSEAICTQPEVLDILRPFQPYPFEIMEKLMEHLDQMVENRSSYYKALAERNK